ncbi:MAG TPA: hypothetical protein VFS90_21970 [Pyrinomonadaceae bacterium]|nr:hypothetical protein [Pyrinomonadaceae bacterium]
MFPIAIPAISTTDAIKVAVAMPATGKDVCESGTTIGSTTIQTTVTRVMTVNKLLALLIQM